MTADKWRDMATRLLAGNGGSDVLWKRRTLAVDGPAGTATVTASTNHTIRAIQLSENTRSLFGAESWQTASVRLCVSAGSLPFPVEAHSGFPEVRFEDHVTWLGVDMRVTFVQAWAAPGGPGQPPKPLAYFVGLAS